MLIAQHFKMNSIELIVRLIIKRDSKILLCKNLKKGHFYLPGGHVEFGDSLEKTIYKEMYEELGLRQENLKNISYSGHLEQIYMEDDVEYHELNMIYTAEVPNDIEMVSQEEHIAFEWVDMKDLETTNVLPKTIIPFLKG